MIRRLSGVVLVLAMLLLACFARLAVDPSSLIVDADHPSLDHARPRDDPSVGNDLTRLFLPHHLAIARTWTKLGRVPLWDDRGFGGRPLVGNPQAGLFYPPVWLAWWSGNPAMLGWITLFHLLVLGLGTYRLSRELKMSVWSALVASGCVEVSPYVLAQTFEGHYPHVWAACWYPWAFFATLKYRQGDRLGGLALAPILAAMMLAGHPQEGYYLVIALGIWAGIDGLILLRSGRFREATRFGAGWVAILLLTIGLTAIELIPDALARPWTLEGVRPTLRTSSRYHVYPINLIQLLDPQALGGPADYFGHENYWESVLSIGLIPLALALIGVAWSSRRQVVRGWLILVIGAVLFGFGRKFGVFPLLFTIVPGMDHFRVPARALFLASLGGAMLAGFGVEALLDRTETTLRWGKLARRATLLVVLVVAFVLWGSLRPTANSTDPGELQRLEMGLRRISAEPAFWLALGIVPLTLILAAKFAVVRRKAAFFLGLMALIELGWHGHQLIVTTPASDYFDPDPISQELREARQPGKPPARIRAVDTLYDDLRAGQAGLLKTNVNDSFQLQRPADLYETLYDLFDARNAVGQAPMDQIVADYLREIRQAVLDRMSVAFLVGGQAGFESSWPTFASGKWAGVDYMIARNPTALPRAYVVPRAALASDDRGFLGRLRRLDPREFVLMDFDPIDPRRTERQPFQPVDWTSDDPDRIVLKVSTSAPGLLVLAESWMPGWSATVDGKAAPVFRGNHAQRVVPLLEPGRHEICLTYWPPGLSTGLGLTIGSAIVWLCLVALVRGKFNPPAADGIGREPRPRR